MRKLFLKRTRLLVVMLLLAVSITGMMQFNRKYVIVNPIPADRFEYEFDLLNGSVIVNPYGIGK
ncbi:hypothetical protein N0M98_18780 [Paenibacillus doosanensis]|uniref:Uncharacterized protein n=1 Tax=Paenibacillus konkukensis TaxID=2020716 RepID=A0ABY4RNC1_9BACL|nr:MULTISPECIES: hypothetical protein [Paenibacillus]MCS7462188.1 hypothetical protein [Paenibacillus doosanensis]UQZ82949.1 hypothetical protein SK3146_02109 [Paenibacillus konkukensis]